VVFDRLPGDARPLVALTYDDGPNPHNTERIAELLAEHEARATFFVIGKKVEDGRESILARTASAGHEIGNHTYSHDPALLGNSAAIRDDIEQANACVAAVTGREPEVFRPPFGKRIRSLSAGARSMGLTTVLWSIDPCDWRDEGPAAVVAAVVSATRPGSIILLHDGGPPRPSVVDGTRLILRELGARGFGFVTVSELLAAASTPREGRPGGDRSP
jgi:peptidoglycan/xylan/chitin deacetylase (PgdA/CDA1 family)